MRDNSFSLPVTVAIHAKNEEANLARCLERLGWFAEVVLVDSGSFDCTVDIAKSSELELSILNVNRKGKEDS